MPKKYSAWSYDVWGNDEDGYSVNDRSCVDRDVIIPDNPTDAELKDILEGYFDMDVCEVSNDCDPDYSYEIVLKEDEYYPVGQLQFEEILPE